ncbi:MAG: hypothetical protein HN742_19445 [Lentisphaerae bacterium]|jgi:hypothetical protein|nr:hypothetical protein [Lentisphaerota bacterium]MBT4814907.1 hypothetical protein [Lentisphaerota bacterium]MBT5605717.1 hypothetical protein [Lentisphaerota bacterium]MBT7055428.1 hypothetical protein [Lentisphaerota bacterium]MBT7844064.1 hypothetical protein [Lentisphaerota bacterium]
MRRTIAMLCFAVFVVSVGAADPPLAVAEGPYLFGQGGKDKQQLSVDATRPTVLHWARPGQAIGWLPGQDGEAEKDAKPKVQWRVEGQGALPAPRDAASWGKWHFCSPSEVLDEGDYTLSVTLGTGADLVTSRPYYITVKFPPVIETSYHEGREEFLGRLARRGRTAFAPNKATDPVVDAPQVTGCDNPAMFDADGTMYIILGDPNIYPPPNTEAKKSLSGALAFTDQIVPEKGLDLAHGRHWVVDPATGVAKSIIDRLKGVSRVNNTGGAVLPHGDGKRLWFAAYDYGGPGKQPSYLRYLRVAICYTDDMFQTPAVRLDDLVVWEKDDPNNGPIEPHPYLGYSMRVFKKHLYMMIPRRKGSPALIRCQLDELDSCSLAQWHYLVSVDDDGRATWSEAGIEKAQISLEDFPTVDFGERPPAIVCSVIWNPYMQRWIAINALNLSVWAAKHFWGPYRNLEHPRRFKITQFKGGYAPFTHDLMLGNNGEWVYYAKARTWIGVGRYGTFNQRLHMRDKLKLKLSQKCGVAGDTISITCTNASGLASPAPDSVSVTVDGNRAAFTSRAGDAYTFTYQVTGRENGGRAGAVDVAAVMEIPWSETTTYRITRDVALVVNQTNDVTCRITSHRDGAKASGTVFLEADARYGSAPEDLGPGRPEVRVIKTELRHVAAGAETVEDVDVSPPYRLKLDTTRYANGPQTFRIVAYDTLDRRGVAAVALEVRNRPQREVAGNLVADGTMEEADTGAWTPGKGGTISKIAGERHRSGTRSLLLRSDTPATPVGATHKVTGLTGGEKLRFSAWSRLSSNYTGTVSWRVTAQNGTALLARRIDSCGYFRRTMGEFENPQGSTTITILCSIRDTGKDSTTAGVPPSSVEAVIDDVVLRPASFPTVEKPVNVRAAAAASGKTVTVTWDAAPDVNVQYYHVYREGEKIGDVASHGRSYTDTQSRGQASAARYAVAAVDEMGTEGEAVQATLVGGRAK